MIWKWLQSSANVPTQDLSRLSVRRCARLCTREDAVKTQVWCANCLLIAIVKDWRKLKFSPYTCPQIFRSWLPRRPLFDAPCPPMANKSEPTAFSAPLILCDLWPDGGATYAFFPAGSPHRQDKRQAGHWQTGARIKPGF